MPCQAPDGDHKYSNTGYNCPSPSSVASMVEVDTTSVVVIERKLVGDETHGYTPEAFSPGKCQNVPPVLPLGEG
jgi:hypothetical protein